MTEICSNDPATRVLRCGMMLIRVEAGTFVMGSPPTEPGRDPDEGPQRRVTISRPFWIGRCPVTQAEYETIRGVNPSRFRDPRRPVEMVSYPDALTFCDKLSEREGVTITLATEAQWEYACRAGAATCYSFGDDPADLDRHAWHAGNARQQTQPVATKQPNAWGLHDMLGNVWEWCLDPWHEPGYDPADTLDPFGRQGYTQVIRGGCFYSDPQALRCAKRLGYNETNRMWSVGFRVVWTDRETPLS